MSLHESELVSWVQFCQHIILTTPFSLFFFFVTTLPLPLFLTPHQPAIVTPLALLARPAIRPQASAPARTESPASPATAALRVTSRAAHPWPRASVSDSHLLPIGIKLNNIHCLHEVIASMWQWVNAQNCKTQALAQGSTLWHEKACSWMKVLIYTTATRVWSIIESTFHKLFKKHTHPDHCTACTRHVFLCFTYTPLCHANFIGRALAQNFNVCVLKLMLLLVYHIRLLIFYYKLPFQCVDYETCPWAKHV